MRILVTGSTGFIGSKLVAALASEGHIIHALYRSERKIPGEWSSNVILYKGDITDKKSLEIAMQNCEAVIHTAAFAGVWHHNENEIYRLNVESTKTILELASIIGVKRCVVTSSAAVYGPSDGKILSETSQPPATFFIPYERSKANMEKMIAGFVAAGQDIVLVNPTRLYGPGPLNDANSVTRLIKMYRNGKWHFLPGNGKSIGNYVYVDDAVRGHILALYKGKIGERYILGGENISYIEFFSILDELIGRHFMLIKFPLPFMLLAAGIMTLFAKLTGIPPMITPGLVRKYNHHWMLSSDKARSELGYNPLSLKEGLSLTLKWLIDEYGATKAE